MKMFAVIDHSGEATNEGLGLRDTKLVIFGSPTAGTPGDGGRAARGTRSAAQGHRLGRRSTTKISYTAPRGLAAHYRLGDDLTDRLAGMDALTDAVIKA
jgi:hypothetical protein